MTYPFFLPPTSLHNDAPMSTGYATGSIVCRCNGGCLSAAVGSVPRLAVSPKSVRNGEGRVVPVVIPPDIPKNPKVSVGGTDQLAPGATIHGEILFDSRGSSIGYGNNARTTAARTTRLAKITKNDGAAVIQKTCFS